MRDLDADADQSFDRLEAARIASRPLGTDAVDVVVLNRAPLGIGRARPDQPDRDCRSNLAIEACMDVADHVVADRRLRVLKTDVHDLEQFRQAALRVT